MIAAVEWTAQEKPGASVDAETFGFISLVRCSRQSVLRTRLTLLRRRCQPTHALKCSESTTRAVEAVVWQRRSETVTSVSFRSVPVVLQGP